MVCDLDRQKLPFEDDTFEYVYASHILEHIDDVAEVVYEIHRVLKPGGILEIRTPYKFSSLDIGHRHFFVLYSFDAFCEDDETPSLQHRKLFDMIDRGYRYGIPFRWHLNKYLLAYLGWKIPRYLKCGLFRNECWWYLKMIRIAQYYHFDYVPDVLAYYQHTTGQLSLQLPQNPRGIGGREYILHKYMDDISKDPNILAHHYHWLGCNCFIAEYIEKARRYERMALKCSTTYSRRWANYLMAYLMMYLSRRAFLKLTAWRFRKWGD